MPWEGCVKVSVRTLLSVHGRLAGIWSCLLMDSFANLGIFSLLGFSFLVLLFSGTFLACSSSLSLSAFPLLPAFLSHSSCVSLITPCLEGHTNGKMRLGSGGSGNGTVTGMG